jgi:hypothetical protein
MERRDGELVLREAQLISEEKVPGIPMRRGLTITVNVNREGDT